MAKSELKSIVAENKARDEDGHFVKEEKQETEATPKNFATQLLESINGSNKKVKESSDDLIDIHVGNPLRRVIELLQDIKKQKAFSFTLKGSLGIAGVALALGLFGVFGGGQMLCEKGTQSYMGTVKTLDYLETESSDIPFIGNFLDYFAPKTNHKKVVLIEDTNNIISLPYSSSKMDFTKYSNYPVIATGSYNSCNKTLTIKDLTGLQIFTR